MWNVFISLCTYSYYSNYSYYCNNMVIVTIHILYKKLFEISIWAHVSTVTVQVQYYIYIYERYMPQANNFEYQRNTGEKQKGKTTFSHDFFLIFLVKIFPLIFWNSSAGVNHDLSTFDQPGFCPKLQATRVMCNFLSCFMCVFVCEWRNL